MKRHEAEEAEVDWLTGCVGGLAFRVCRFLQTVPCLKEVFREGFFGYRLIIDLYPLTDESEVWRSVEPNLFQKRFRLSGRRYILS